MKRYADQPFNSEDMYRIPADVASSQPVVYQMPKQTDNRKRPLLGGKPYSIWSASKYILMISLMLYWLPLVGQMIGGFIGGRRAGSPFRAIIAALIPVAVLFGISTALQTGFIPIKLQNATVLAYTLIAQGLERLPIASPYVNFATTYVGSFIDELKTAASLKVGNYLITIAFAYVGGILSDQSRRELEYVSRYGAPTTNILVSGREGERREGFHMPSPAAFFHHLMPQRQRQPSGFANLLPLPYSANGSAQALQAAGAPPEGGVAPAVARPTRVMHRRIAAQEARPRSWEDVYLRNMRIAGLSGSGVSRTPYGRPGMSRPSPRWYPAEEEVERPVVRNRVPEQRAAPAVVRRDHIRDESTRRLVERALGKEYVKNIGTTKRRPAAGFQAIDGEGRGGATAERQPTVRKNGEWELL